VPADRPAAGHGLYRRHGARDTVAFLGLVQIGMAFPPPPVRRDLVAAAHRILRQQRQPFDGLAARTHRRWCTVLSEHLHDPPPAGTRTVLEMAVDRRIRPAGEALLDFVHRLVLGIAVGNRELRALLEIDDNGHRHPGAARPARIGWRAGISEQIAGSGHSLRRLRHSAFLARCQSGLSS
jgi:hypothetical protein